MWQITDHVNSFCSWMVSRGISTLNSSSMGNRRSSTWWGLFFKIFFQKQRKPLEQCVFFFFLVLLLQVNQKGSEKPLEQAFAKMVSGMNNGMLR